MLVVMEGLDGSGKSTQVANLRKYLESLSGTVEYIHFPRYDAPLYGELIGKFLRGGFGDINDVHPQLVALLYAEDRHGACDEMKRALASGGTLLLDRYVYSNVAYQCAKIKDPGEREALREWILNTEFGLFGLPRPDLNIFLDVPIGFVESKLTSSRKGNDREYLSSGSRDIHEANIEFQRAVREVYARQASLDPRFIRIDCSAPDGSMLPQEVVSEKVREVTDKYIH